MVAARIVVILLDPLEVSRARKPQTAYNSLDFHCGLILSDARNTIWNRLRLSHTLCGDYSLSNKCLPVQQIACECQPAYDLESYAN
jgi:hypothetical protein